MSKVFYKIVKSCRNCPCRRDGGAVEDICSITNKHIYSKYMIYDKDDDCEEFGFPKWCPLDDGEIYERDGETYD